MRAVVLVAKFGLQKNAGKKAVFLSAISDPPEK
jgi:hypothetical protein